MPHAMTIPHTGGPDVLIRQTKTVAKPGPRDVLIRNYATAVNYIDTIIRRGEMPDGMMPALPHTPGVEGAGVVDAVGVVVKSFRPGDRVAWMGPIGAGAMVHTRSSASLTSPAWRTTISRRPPRSPSTP